jgi:hypothetical protein
MDDQLAYKFPHASIKVSQVNIKKYITYLKRLDKGRQTWEKTCIDSILKPKK